MDLTRLCTKERTQLIKFGIQPADAYMSNDGMDMVPNKFKMKGMKFAELIETCIKAPDVELFMSDFFEVSSALESKLSLP